MSLKSAPLAAWPWEWMGTFKYFLYAPVGVRLLLKCSHGESLLQDFCFHILLLTLLRCCIYEGWHLVSRSNFFWKTRRIQKVGVDFDQVDREFDWDNYLLLQALVAAVAQACFPEVFSQLPLWNWMGIAVVSLLHVGPTEFLYYYTHRAFHHGHLYEQYHSLHHASKRPEPSTAGTGSFLEHSLLTVAMSIPIVGVILVGRASLGILYAYVLGFDFLRSMIHSNVEVVPIWLFDRFPFLRYLLITPTYHSLHHTLGKLNYCLFVPLYDCIGGTMNKTAFELHAELRNSGKEVVPDSVFLPHGVDIASVLHLGFLLRTYSSVPRGGSEWFTFILIPVFLLGTLILWFLPSDSYVMAQFTFRGIFNQVWAIPRTGFQFFTPNAFKDINKLLENAILEADRKGVKVVALGGLNKNEAMNGGGALFVDKHRNLKVRVCHGNTLTAAVILRQLPKYVTEVFLTGSTSKIGKAIALYLCRKRVRVLMLTTSQDRFNAIVEEAPNEFKQYLVQATKYQADLDCWQVGRIPRPAVRSSWNSLPSVHLTMH